MGGWSQGSCDWNTEYMRSSASVDNGKSSRWLLCHNVRLGPSQAGRRSLLRASCEQGRKWVQPLWGRHIFGTPPPPTHTNTQIIMMMMMMMQFFSNLFSLPLCMAGFYIPRAKIPPIKARTETALAEVCCFGSPSPPLAAGGFLFSLGYILLSVALTHCKYLVSVTDSAL